MSDDLVKWLRDVDYMSVEDCFLRSPLYAYAADRIEELEVERDEWKALAEAAIKDDAAKNIHYAEVRARVKKLEAELHLMKTSGIVEVSVRNPNVMEYMKHWESRAEAAEAKLAKAVEALSVIDALDHCFEGMDVIRATLAELKGEKP